MILNLYFIGSMAVLFTFAYVIGMMLPSRYYVSSVQVMQVPARCLWNRIVKFSRYHTWRMDLKSVKVISDHEWMETDCNNDQIWYSMTILEDKKKLRIDITNTNLVYRRSWIVDMHTVGKFTIVRITEDGEVFEPFFRTLGRYVIGFRTPMNRYFRYMEQAYRKRAEPELLKKTIHIFDLLNIRPIIQPFIKINKNHRPYRPYFSFE